MLSLRVCIAVAVLSSAAVAQIGPYPGGQYPGSGGGQTGPGLPFPWPRSKKKGSSDKSGSSERVTTTSGTVRKAGEKSVTVEVSDARMLEFLVTAETKLYREGKEVVSADLKPGDQVTVEATEDHDGYLHARSVRVDKPAAKATAPAAQPGEAAPEAPQRSATKVEPANDGEWRPVLRRGIPPKRQGPDKPEESEPPEEDTHTVASAASSAGVAAQAVPAQDDTDPLIIKARDVAALFAQQLTSFVCREFMARFASDTRPADFRPLDVVSVDLVVDNKHETYRNLAVNNKPVKKSIEEVGGSWSTGEFITILLDLFSPYTAADFHFRRDAIAAGKRAKVYDFTVSQTNSHWHVTVASQSMDPAYKGSVWIDPATAHVLRIEMQTRSLPPEFPLDTVETAVDYDAVRIGDKMALLPVHSESLSCQRGSFVCSKNVIDFRNYHKYEAESNITFKEEKKEEK